VGAARSGRVKSSPGEQTVGELSAENARLRKELAEARMEREILPLVVSTPMRLFLSLFQQ